jgi:hypothetical protein
VTRNARRKAIGYLRDYIASTHPDLAANFALTEFVMAIRFFRLAHFSVNWMLPGVLAGIR